MVRHYFKQFDYFIFVRYILLRLLVCDSLIINLFVAGQEQHVGTKAPPPEIVLENAVMRTEPAIVRVQVISENYKLTVCRQIFVLIDRHLQEF